MTTVDMGSRSHRHFGEAAARLRARGIDAPQVLEIGSWTGASLAAWDATFAGRAKFVAVDRWEPYPLRGNSNFPYDAVNGQLASGEARREFNARVAGIMDRVEIVVEDSHAALVRFADERRLFDLVYVDGDHRLEAARADIAGALIILKRGGVVCGDDLERQLFEIENLDRHDTAAASGLDYVDGYHPGVTQAVGELFGRVWCRDAFWMVDV
jgi:predicted O-methyltransferase YrrM